MQTTYNNLAPSVKGGLADAGENDIVTGVAIAAIQFGQGLAVGTDGKALVPTATGFVPYGIAVQKNNAVQNATGLAQYDIGQAISVLRKGRIWVYAEQAVNPTLAVYLRHTTNAALLAGDFRVDADTARADILVGAKWMGVTTAAGLALLEINIAQ